MNRSVLFGALALSFILVTGGCSSLPPGTGQPKPVTSALDPSIETDLGKKFAPLAKAHEAQSGFRMLSAGIDGLTARVEMIDAAQRSLDLQYYIFRADDSGGVVVQSLLRAAERGVRIRILTDDGETIPGDERILSMAAFPGIEVRIFNPLRYRGHNRAIRGAEFLFGKARVDYRMHNKLLVADNAVAIIGGRNIGDQYFQIDPESQFGDDDVVVAGPMVQRLSGTFDEFWNCSLSVPAQAVDKKHTSAQALSRYRAELARRREKLDAERRAAQTPAARQPFLDILANRTPLIWAQVKLAYDSPDKKDVDKGDTPGRLIYRAVAEQANAVDTEFLVVTPYFVPSSSELALLKADRQRNVHVRILTNSLQAAPSLAAQSGYMHYRTQLLQQGVELYEVRALLGSARGSGQSKAISRHGNYGLHAKLFVFDRKTVFVGSMNFDQRSRHLNTEIGLLIASPELSRETAVRFDALTQLDNAYAVSLSESPGGKRPRLVWTTREAGTIVQYQTEPARSRWQRVKVELLSILPLDKEL